MAKFSRFRDLALPALMCLVGALLCVQAWRYIGLVGRIGEWQFSDIDIYFPGLTVLLLLVVISIPVLLLALVLRRKRRRARADDTVTLAVEEPYRRSIATSTALMRYLYFVAGAAAVGLLACLAIPVARDGDGHLTQAVDMVEHVRAGGLPSRLDGRIDDRHVAVYSQGIGWLRHDIFVTPVVMRGTTLGRDQQRYFAELTAPDLDGGAAGPGPAGYLRRAAFPQQLVALYRGHGIHVAPDAFMLFASRESRDWSCYVAAIQFFVFGLLAIVLGSVFRWRRRRVAEHMAGLALPGDRITRR